MRFSEDHPVGKTVLNLRAQYEDFSKSTRILVIVGAASMLLLAIVEMWALADSYDQQTNQLLSQMNSARQAQQEMRPAFRDKVASLGIIRLPSRNIETIEAERNLKFRVDTILKENGAENVTSDVAPGAALAANKLPEIPREPGRRIAKVSLRVEFDCKDANATSIIRSLESDPEIYTISRVQLRRYTDGQEQVRKMVNMTLTIETWALAPSRLGGRG